MNGGRFTEDGFVFKKAERKAARPRRAFGAFGAGRRAVGLLLAAALLLCGFMGLPGFAIKVLAADNVPYYNPISGTTLFANGVNPLPTSGTVSAGWYIASGNVTVSGRLTISGAVNIILADGCVVNNTNGGIGVPPSTSLTIWGQSANADKSAASNTGKLNSTATINSDGGIGGATWSAAGSITINGGNIIARASSYGAGIGGGDQGSHTTIIVNGGTVEAYGGTSSGGSGAGIGNGSGLAAGENAAADGRKIEITGGKITAQGGPGTSAGIGGGSNGRSGDITISGGTVKATGTNGSHGNAAGIGGGGNNSGTGLVKITGGTVIATGGNGVPGIGEGSTTGITITGGSIDATMRVTPTNGYVPVSLNTVTVNQPGTSTPAANTFIASGVINGVACQPVPVPSNSGTTSVYGINDTKTDAAGKIYVWLPPPVNSTGFVPAQPLPTPAVAIDYEAETLTGWENARYSVGVTDTTQTSAETEIIFDATAGLALPLNAIFEPIAGQSGVYQLKNSDTQAVFPNAATPMAFTIKQGGTAYTGNAAVNATAIDDGNRLLIQRLSPDHLDLDSAAQTVDVPKRPAMPSSGLATVKNSSSGMADGEITGLTADIAYYRGQLGQFSKIF